jgi:N12 class adenine-specific DNA methylase
LARWSGWGAVPTIFDESSDQLADQRAELHRLLDDRQWRAAARTTLNAHYTDAAIAQVMWDVLTEHGFGADGAGQVLEPGCGAGTFLGMAPPSATQLTGIELDPRTAAIARHLYPHADIRTESFADTRIPAGSLDLVIGNVPFGKIALHDKVHNAGGHSLHNYFILKSLALTRPGGVVCVLTSHYTMDASNPAARREIAGLADLVAAVRLPMSAHQRAAGTQVITDVLILRRRDDPAADPGSATGWDITESIGGDEARQVYVNEYFIDHPDRVIGATGTRSGPFGPELEVSAGPDTDIAAQLRTHIDDALRTELARDPAWRMFGQRTAAPQRPASPPPAAPINHQQDHIDVDGHGGFTIVDQGALVPHPVPRSQARELTALLKLRDTTVALLAAEAATSEDTEAIDGLRQRLNQHYDAYVKAFGPINRISYRRTGRVDEVTGEDRLARIAPPQGRFRIDPHAPAVYALENFDAVTGTARKAPIMAARVVAPRAPRLGADTPADAVAICLDTYGEVRLAEVARLLGRSEDATRQALTGLVFTDPDTPARLVPAAEYLSGNVRTKLAAAEAAAERDAAAAAHRWDENIAALRGVLPADLTPAEIDARMGASWIEAEIVQQFLRELLDDPNIEVENPRGSTWAVRGGRYSVLSTSTYGTNRAAATDLAAALLEQRQIRVTDELEDGKRILNLTETVAAQEKAAEISERFSEWIWSDPHRASTLARRYNDMFNSIVLRSYDGTQMQLPGLTVTFTPRPHQTAAVARIVSEPSVLLAHEVGAGKTAEMVIGAMELRRLGMVRKPAVVVPNHMLEQFSREWMQLYPQARILAASIDDLARDRRRLMVARIATGDWDAVILSRSAFERVPLSPAAQQRYFDSQLADMREQLDRARGGRGLTVKRLEGALARAEERLKKLTDGAKDPGITFEETGIDYLFVDEAHGYKNLRTVSNIPGVAIEGSQRASDLDMKLDFLRGRHGGRVATFATATPIANSVSEAYTMQRFLRPDLLTAAGLTDFDTWAATFGEVTTDLELAPDGSRFRMQSRFAKFRNVPELLRMWHVSADIKTAEDLHLPTPDLRGGQAETVVVPATDELEGFMRELSERADRVQNRQVDPDVDNMLRIATHGRMAALDLRLLGRRPGENTKLLVAADRIAEIHHANADRAYPDSDTLGSLQIVFCDLGTPQARRGSRTAGEWNVYDELKQLLIARDIPANAIRYVHEARNDKEKGELFAAARNGRVSVLLGSTEKMGLGTNVQARAIALHHLDCPWRPADIAQREGRILRQGNLNPEVEILRYVSEGSFDAYLWQTVERKARFIGQVMRGRLDVREIEDIGETALSYSEVKALATGDPRILEKARVDADLTRLERLERSHARNQRVLSSTITDAERTIPQLDAERDAVDAAIARRVKTTGEHFLMAVGTTRWTSRADAATALRAALIAIPPAEGTRDGTPQHVATIAGFQVIATARRYLEPHLTLELADVPRSTVKVEYKELRNERPLGLIQRLENRATDLEHIRDRIFDEQTRLAAEADRARADYNRPFPHAQALADVRIRSAQLTEELAKTDTGQQPSQQTPPTAAGGATTRRAAPGAPAPSTTSPPAPAVADRRLPRFRERLQANFDAAGLPVDISIEIDQYGADPTVFIHHDGGRAIVRLDATHRDHLDPRQVITMALDVARRESIDPRFTSESRAGSARLADRLTEWLTPPPTAGDAGEATPQRTHRDAPRPDRGETTPPELPATAPDEHTSTPHAVGRPRPSNDRAEAATQQLIRAEVGDREIGPPIRAGAATAEATKAIREHLGLAGLDVVDAEHVTGRVSGWMVSHPQPYGREPRRLFYPDATPAARPPTEHPNHDRAVAAAATSAKPKIRVEHTKSGTLVHGTERGDTEVHEALKQQAFKWSRNLGAWYLPRNYRYQTRSQRVRALKRTLGDQISIDYGEPAPQTPPAADLSAASGDALTPGQPPRTQAAITNVSDAAQPAVQRDQIPVSTVDPRTGSLAELERDAQERFHSTGGRYGIWDMRDGRFLAIEEGLDGYPRSGAPAGPPFGLRAQVDAYVAALNAGASSDQALHAAYRADPSGFQRGGTPTKTEVQPQPPATSLVIENAPPGGWTDADKVQPVTHDTSHYPSAQRYPLGTDLTVHAIGQNGPGRRLGHGVVVDYPGPDHVTVESPYGTKRIAHINYVSLTSSPPPDPTREDLSASGWKHLCDAIDPRITADPHWPALAAQLDRAAAAGTDVASVLQQAAADRTLPTDHPARSLAYRVADAVPDNASPGRTRLDTPPPAGPIPRPPAAPPRPSGPHPPAPRI